MMNKLWYIQGTTLYSKANEQILLKIHSNTTDLHKYVEEIRDEYILSSSTYINRQNSGARIQDSSYFVGDGKGLISRRPTR